MRVASSFLVSGFLLTGFAFNSSLSAAQPNPRVDLRMDKLAAGLKLLTDKDHEVVEQVIELIRNGQHQLAFARLGSLNESNPRNSSLRILSAYVQLQLGNLLGAFDDAAIAESAPNGNSYKCFFLAKLALISGDRLTCRRELGHVKAIGDMPAEARQLESDLKKAKP